MLDFKIRKANLKDAKAILDFVKDLAAFERQPDAVIIDENEIIKQAFSDNPLIYIYVAEAADAVIGIALFYYRFSTWKGKSLHLEDLIVNEEYRGKGVGKALMDKVLEVAHKENVGRMEWEVLEWNESAIKFYESLGTNIDPEWNLCKLTREDIGRLVI